MTVRKMTYAFDNRCFFFSSFIYIPTPLLFYRRTIFDNGCTWLYSLINNNGETNHQIQRYTRMEARFEYFTTSRKVIPDERALRT